MKKKESAKKDDNEQNRSLSRERERERWASGSQRDCYTIFQSRFKSGKKIIAIIIIIIHFQDRIIYCIPKIPLLF